MHRFLFSATLITALIFCENICQGKENSDPMFYQMNVKIEPAINFIEVKAKIKHPPESRFILNKNMKIKRIKIDGKDVSFQVNDSMPGPMEVAVETKGLDELEIEYSGTISDCIANVNLITSNLVELALYSQWFPQFKGGSLFTFRLDTDLPKGYITEVNGVLQSRKINVSRDITSWESLSPDFDIALVASPNLKKLKETRNRKTVEIYYDQLPIDYVKTISRDLLKARKILEDLYGEPDGKRDMRIVYSPREGWGYSRSGFIVISEKRTLNLYQGKFGQEEDFAGITHEICHFWWGLADIYTPDDWINEGLAEYSMFRVVERTQGREFVEELLKRYKQHVAEGRTETPIAETESSSPDREVNRYDKPTLMFIEAQKKFGSDKLDQFLRSLYSRFKGTTNLTTRLFLEEAERQIGPEAKEFFSKNLYAKRWGELN